MGDRVCVVHSFIPPLRFGDLFTGLSRAGRSRLDTISRPHLVSCDDFVFKPGSAPAIWVLDSGEAVICPSSFDKDVDTHRIVAPGDVLGLTEVLAEVSFSAYLTAVSDCRFINIDSSEFIRLLRAEPLFRTTLLTLIAEANVIAGREITGR